MKAKRVNEMDFVIEYDRRINWIHYGTTCAYRLLLIKKSSLKKKTASS